MQDLEKLKEIEELGLEEPDSPEPQEPEGRGGSNVPLVQGALCLLVFGADAFIIPSMACVLVLLTALRRPIERRCGLL